MSSTPPNWPNNIPIQKQTFQNWSQGITVFNVWTCIPQSPDDVVLISFFGDGSKQSHPDAETAIQPIDRVHFGFQGNTEDFVATGSCRFSDPYKGKPSLLSCSADTNRGKFSVEFVSNGRPPETTRIPEQK